MQSNGEIKLKNWVPQAEKKNRAQKAKRSQRNSAVQRGKKRLPKVVVSIALLIGALFLLAAIYQWFEQQRVSVFTVEVVKIEGDLTESQALRIESLLMPYLKGDFFKVNLGLARSTIEKLSWVRGVEIQRQWPNAVWVNISLQQPVALWNGTLYMNDSAEVYGIDVATGESANLSLPKLYGSSGTQMQVMQQYKYFASVIDAADVEIESLIYDERGSWKIIFDNEIELMLGFDDVSKRLQRFVAVYNAYFFEKQATIKSVDLRYSNGLAVMWKAMPQTNIDAITRS